MLPPSATGGPRWSKPYATKKIATEQLNAALHLVASGELGPAQGVKLGQYGERWLAQCKHRTAEDDRGRWRRFVATRPIAQMALADITTGHVKRFVESVARTRKLVPTGGEQYARKVSKDTVSAQTVRHVFGLLSRCLNEAIVDGHLTRNPCTGYRLPVNVEKQRTSEAAIFLDAEEVERAVSCPAVGLKYRLIYEVAIFTGLRQGELWGLRWEDLDLDGPTPRCASQRSYRGPTKNSKTRFFCLLPRAAAALRRWRDLAKYSKPGDYVFPGPKGRMHAKGYDAGWSKNREKIGISREKTFHALRHSFVSHLVMGSWGRQWRIEEVRPYIGHSSISVTQRYAHLSPDHLADLVAQTTTAPSFQADPEE